MSLVNHVYNLFWDFVDLKIWERFGFSEFSYQEGMSFVMGEIDEDGEFSGWINELWNSRDHGDVLSMADTLNVLKYVTSRNPISLDTLTPESLIDRCGMIIARVEAGKLSDFIHAKIARFSTPATTSSADVPQSPQSPPRKRKRCDLAECSSKKRRRDEDSHVRNIWPETPTFYSRLNEKMNNDISFCEWVQSGDCLRPISTRPVLHKGLGKLMRDTCDPVEWKLEWKCVRDGITFEQLVGRYEYVMQRRDFDSVKDVLIDYYPYSDDLEELTRECVRRRIHPDDYDFNYVDDVNEWNKRLDLIPNTSKLRRRSERLRLAGVMRM